MARTQLKLVEAIATEAGTAETTKIGSVHEGAGRRHRPETAHEIALRIRSGMGPSRTIVQREITRSDNEIWI